MNQTLVEIHNALCSISVKGEDAITMAKCLMTLRELVEQSVKENEEDVNV